MPKAFSLAGLLRATRGYFFEKKVQMFGLEWVPDSKRVQKNGPEVGHCTQDPNPTISVVCPACNPLQISMKITRAQEECENGARGAVHDGLKMNKME